MMAKHDEFECSHGFSPSYFSEVPDFQDFPEELLHLVPDLEPTAFPLPLNGARTEPSLPGLREEEEEEEGKEEEKKETQLIFQNHFPPPSLLPPNGQPWASRKKQSKMTIVTPGPDSPTKVKRNRHACWHCNLVKRRCDSGRPCARCVQRGLQDECRDFSCVGVQERHLLGLLIRKQPDSKRKERKISSPSPQFCLSALRLEAEEQYEDEEECELHDDDDGPLFTSKVNVEEDDSCDEESIIIIDGEEEEEDGDCIKTLRQNTLRKEDTGMDDGIQRKKQRVSGSGKIPLQQPGWSYSSTVTGDDGDEEEEEDDNEFVNEVDFNSALDENENEEVCSSESSTPLQFTCHSSSLSSSSSSSPNTTLSNSPQPTESSPWYATMPPSPSPIQLEQLLNCSTITKTIQLSKPKGKAAKGKVRKRAPAKSSNSSTSMTISGKNPFSRSKSFPTSTTSRSPSHSLPPPPPPLSPLPPSAIVPATKPSPSIAAVAVAAAAAAAAATAAASAPISSLATSGLSPPTLLSLQGSFERFQKSLMFTAPSPPPPPPPLQPPPPPPPVPTMDSPASFTSPSRAGFYYGMPFINPYPFVPMFTPYFNPPLFPHPHTDSHTHTMYSPYPPVLGPSDSFSLHPLPVPSVTPPNSVKRRPPLVQHRRHISAGSPSKARKQPEILKSWNTLFSNRRSRKEEIFLEASVLQSFPDLADEFQRHPLLRLEQDRS